MLNQPYRRTILLLLLAAVLAAPRVSAAGPRRSEPGRQASAIVEPVPFNLIAHLRSILRSVWSKEGCRIDPSGRCAPAAVPPLTIQVESGCSIDPSGRCQS